MFPSYVHCHVAFLAVNGCWWQKVGFPRVGRIVLLQLAVGFMKEKNGAL